MRDTRPFNLGQDHLRGGDISRGVAIGFAGALLALIGGTLEIVGAAISLEERKIEEEQLEQRLYLLQKQIDEINGRLVKEQVFKS
ncbi:hypothetical protein [Edaphobacillus lindanitolerans]|uniref:Uncharacterized protein n=1 Tax=Edaphobacillus lindanitolerans TaxID=550447 RepID=A0A1U7PP28_9BACI|nr:hypothetical protein [Edaphobacillus lindanitolerans]SIT87169.1 hypothetical protein SAMN05428946_1974 [Edaphobacillus lindanitolerans]